DRVAADFCVDDEGDAARCRRTDEDEPVFVRRGFATEVDAVRVLEAGRGFFETDAIFPAILSRFLRVPGEAHAFSVTRKCGLCHGFARPDSAHHVGRGASATPCDRVLSFRSTQRTGSTIALGGLDACEDRGTSRLDARDRVGLFAAGVLE